MLVFRIFLISIVMIMAFPSLAAKVSVEKGYVRATIPGTQVSSAYMVIKNPTNKALSLIGVSSNVSDKVELHEHAISDGMMKMRQIEAINVPANGELVLQPAGYHVMIFNLQQPLQENDTLSLTLDFAETDDLSITLPIESIKRKKSHHHHH